MLTKERKKRYQEKINLIEKRISEIEEWTDEIEKKGDEKVKLACYKAFQEIAEAFFDLIAMKIKDLNKLVEDDYTNIDRLKNLNFLNEKEARILKEVNGLRNRLVHKYNQLNDAVAQESIKNLLPFLNTLLEKFRK
ncbi:MAG: DUF86 domain-containing protein [Candidatus Pacearchaeota archaeon]